MLLSLNNVSFTHTGAVDPLFGGVTVNFPTGWTGIVGANGTGKTTLLRLACGGLEPDSGSVQRSGPAIYCPQRTDSAPSELGELLRSIDPDACDIRGRLGVQADWRSRWDTLSHGERKRAQIAVALWREPDILALDEPTNHIDADARELLMRVLRGFRGIGLVVSHDRELLDSLCERCVFVEPPRVTMRSGNYSDASHQAKLEDQHTRDEREQAKATAERLHREAVRRRDEAARADSRRSKMKIAAKDHDAKGKIDAARVSGADGKAGRLSAQMDSKAHRAEARLDEFDIKRHYEASFWLDCGRSGRNALFSVPEGEIDLGSRRLRFPELTMTPDARIAITGPNGAGKSTLLRHILDRLTLPEDKLIYIPQEIDLEQSRRIMREVNGLSRDRLGRVMTLVSCLGSRPGRLVGSDESSPGEIRKILLALGVSNSPHLIILDEPTNHLDLPAIECLENALADCPCGLLLVSHDYRFLSRLATVRWHLCPNESGDVELRVMGI